IKFRRVFFKNRILSGRQRQLHLEFAHRYHLFQGDANFSATVQAIIRIKKNVAYLLHGADHTIVYTCGDKVRR
ncbi:hypothetical protein, partial [Pseudomonas syringae group genomosp. 7]|uniref:hypothetical protein n=1 Tax=Pseudomonas syringae group genomosp. 7 TaxID=251699 RepID=UPI0037700BDA